MLDYNIQRYVDICTAFGWQVFTVDGHDIAALISVIDEAHQMNEDKPVMIIAKTIKGYGVDFVAGKQGFHGKALTGNQETLALQQLEKNFLQAAAYKNEYNWRPLHPQISAVKHRGPCEIIMMPEPEYVKGEMIATRKAYGVSLAHLGDVCDSVVCLDAEVKNSTYTDIFESVHTNRFFQCFVAEQNMIGMGIGFERRGKMPFISTFSSFFSRAHDQIRMAAIGNSALRLVGSHCGVSIGEDGPSQMGLEDIAIMRCLPQSIVLYPADAVSTYKLVEQMARYQDGISYLRTTRMTTPVIYDNDEQFPIGGCKVLKKSDGQDKVCVIGAGVTLFEALKAYEILMQQNVFISVIDLYSIKPLDSSTVKFIASQSKNKIIAVEDHYQEGGIGEAVRSALVGENIEIHSLSVSKLPRSGKPEELLAFENIDAAAIINLITNL
jgi:transketolase